MSALLTAGTRRPWPRTSWPRSAWPTCTPGSTRRSGRWSWPGTGWACRPSRRPRTTPRSRPTTWRGPAARPIGPSGCPTVSAAAIARRLDGDRRVRIDLDLRGHTDFERDVWHKALEIPRGEVRPYGWVAAEIGRPKAVRAVGTALGHNPVPLIVPCHRVVRTDGSIGQYSLGGPENKRTILAAEGLDSGRDGVGRPDRHALRRLGHDPHRAACRRATHAQPDHAGPPGRRSVAAERGRRRVSRVPRCAGPHRGRSPA